MRSEAMGASTGFLFLLMVLLVVPPLQVCRGEIRESPIQDDSRTVIVIASFGFTLRGRLELQVSDALWKVPNELQNKDPALMGFLLTTEEDWVQVILELEQNPNACVLQNRYIKRLFTFSDLNSSYGYNGTFDVPSANQYSLMFSNCLPDTKVSMSVMTSMYNLEGPQNLKNFLSEGQTQLPTLFFCFFVVYVSLEVLWIYVCARHKDTTHWIHLLMAGLLLLKALYLFSEAEDKAFVKRTGTPHGWDIAFYAFSFLKGIMLFAVIALIGMGWSFLKPYIQGKEKQVLMIVIPLQVLANIGAVVIGEAGRSDKDWAMWSQLLLLIDVVCCCAVLFPIVWSIRHLREAARTDGKAARNLAKLTLFRQYYIVVVSYVYFTRIVVFALTTVASYRLVWMAELARELATLAFYVFTGFKFRPAPRNPYFVLDDDDEDAAAEEALKDDDFEL